MIELEPESIYHIYNRANGSEKIFAYEGNYYFFLDKFKFHLAPVTNLFCYCLMRNHFHFLLQIKTEKELKEVFPLSVTEDFPRLISKKFSNFFSSYSQAYNKEQKRMGSLFMKNYKRKKVDSQEYLMNLVSYIHNNPVKAGVCKTPEQWKFSSYRKILTQDSGFIQCKSVVELFDDLESFKAFHSNPLKTEEEIIF